MTETEQEGVDGCRRRGCSPQWARRFPQNGCGAPTWPRWRGVNEQNVFGGARAVVRERSAAALSE